MSDSIKNILKDIISDLAFSGTLTYGQYQTKYRDRVEALNVLEPERTETKTYTEEDDIEEINRELQDAGVLYPDDPNIDLAEQEGMPPQYINRRKKKNV